MKLSGVISDRLRQLFSDDEILRSPHPDRIASPTPKPPPKNASGTQLSKNDRTTK